MKKNRRRADRAAATLAESGNDGERQAARRLVGCRACNMNFFRDVCTRALVPSHYRVKQGKTKGVVVEMCDGSRQRFRKPHPLPDDVPWR